MKFWDNNWLQPSPDPRLTTRQNVKRIVRKRGGPHTAARREYKRIYWPLKAATAVCGKTCSNRLTCDRHRAGLYVPVQPLWNELAHRAAGY